MSDLAVPKGKKVKRPKREPDMLSKRGVPYWFEPEWVRGTGTSSMSRIKAIKSGPDLVELFMCSISGNLTYIQGSIQREFQDWCEDREIDCILLGVDMNDVIATDWEYEDK